MPLKFACRLCSHVIIAETVYPDDILRCPVCGGSISVPSEAAPTDEPLNLTWWKPPIEAEVETSAQSGPLPLFEPTPWGITDILKFFGLLIIGAILLWSLLALFSAAVITLADNPGPAWPSDWHEPYRSLFRSLLGILLQLFEVGLVYYIVVKKHHNDFFKALRLHQISRRSIIKYSLITLAIFGVVMSAAIIIYTTPIKDYYPKNFPRFNYMDKGIIVLLLYSISGLIAPFSEEVVYRGFMFSGLQRKLSRNWAAVVVSVIFIASHGTRVLYNPLFLATLIMISIVLIVIRIKTDSLTKPIIVHFSYNLFVTSLRLVIYILIAMNIVKNHTN